MYVSLLLLILVIYIYKTRDEKLYLNVNIQKLLSIILKIYSYFNWTKNEYLQQLNYHS